MYGSKTESESKTLTVSRFYSSWTSRSYSFASLRSLVSRSGTNLPKAFIKGLKLKRLYTFVPVRRWWNTGLVRYKWKFVKTPGKRKYRIRCAYPVKVLQTRLVRKRIRGKKLSLVGYDLPSNALSFKEVKTDPVSSETWEATHSSLPQLYRLSGDLLQTFNDKPFGSVVYYVYGRLDDYVQNVPHQLSLLEGRAGDVAYQRILDRLKDEKVNLAMCFAERRQTAALFADVTRRIAEAVKAAKSGRGGDAWTSLFPVNSKELAGDVLAIDFGLKPLLSDLDGAARALAELETSSDRAVTFHATGTELLPETVVYSQVSNDWVYCKTEVIQSGQVQVKHSYTFKPVVQILRTADELGANPAQVLWEATPWSFVVDWFVNVGDFLANLTALTGFEFIKGHRTVTYRLSTTLRRTYGGTRSRQGFTGPVHVVERSGSMVKVNRYLVSSPPTLPIPRLQDPVSLSHVRDALALLIQQKR